MVKIFQYKKEDGGYLTINLEEISGTTFFKYHPESKIPILFIFLKNSNSTFCLLDLEEIQAFYEAYIPFIEYWNNPF